MNGYNYRMSNVLAGIGRGQLQVLGERVAARRHNFAYYRDTLGDLPGLDFMPEAPWGCHTRWLTCITVDPAAFGADREQVRLALEAENIEARPVWKPMHLQPVFAGCLLMFGWHRSTAVGMFCLPWIASPIVLQQLVTGGDLLTNSIFVPLFVYWLLHTAERASSNSWRPICWSRRRTNDFLQAGNGGMITCGDHFLKIVVRCAEREKLLIDYERKQAQRTRYGHLELSRKATRNSVIRHHLMSAVVRERDTRSFPRPEPKTQLSIHRLRGRSQR